MRIESIQCDVCKKPLGSEELFVNFMAFFNDGKPDLPRRADSIDVCRPCFDSKFAAYFSPEKGSSSYDVIASIAKSSEFRV